ncbi:MAG: hypothetical protein ACYCS4_09930 [Acidimicrobiales bacterium]
MEDSELVDDGACPDCGDLLPERRKVPWHFKAVIIATTIYLGYRTYQGVTWVAHHV